VPAGGFCPLPTRLGGDELTGLSPQAHAALCGALRALVASSRFATLTYVKSGATVTVEGYTGQHGTGVEAAPTPTVNGTGDVTWTWQSGYVDAYGDGEPINLSHGKGTCHYSVTTPIQHAVVTATANTMRVVTSRANGTADDGRVTVSVW
jgi:hypothetical protein